MLRFGILIGLVSIGFLWIQQGNTFSNEKPQTKRILTPEEQELANAARAHIAKVVEKNLIRLFAAMTVEEHRQSRQQFGFPNQQRQQQQEEEEEDDPAETATINPHTLPQVAALLGAIFSGNLNLTNVVDRAFYLVPDAVRTQVTGLFKLLGGNPLDQLAGSSATAAPSPSFIPHPLDITTTQAPTNLSINSTEPLIAVENTTTLEQETTTLLPVSRPTEPDLAAFGLVFVPSTQPPSLVEQKKPITDIEQPVVPIAEGNAYYSDDTAQPISEEELKKAEEEIIETAKLYEPFVRDKQPRFFLGSLRQIFRSDAFNLTTIFRVMPDIFKGARQAFVLLESLGQIVSGERDLEDLGKEE